MNVLQGAQHSRIDVAAYVVGRDLHQYGYAEQNTMCELLQPIEDASHTRDRKRSPPDSACMRGTRLEVVRKVGAWTSSCVLIDGEPHICWMHGYVGSGKSAISLEICTKSESQGQPVASFFFFRNAGDRSRIWRFATTVADQMAAAVPETAPFVRAAATARPGLKNFPMPVTSVAMQMQRLVYEPFKSAVDLGPIESLAGRPFLIVIDGLDECEDKGEVEELIDSMLSFFDDNPFIPLRIFITSRVEQHIQSRLNVPGVRFHDLVDHCSDDDITSFLEVLFQDAGRRNPVIQAYVREHGEWPTPSEKRKLVRHIGGSFIFASAVFKFIMGSNAPRKDPTTPMDRLPLALKMNPGLDGLYAQTLERSEHIPHFLNVISTIALLHAPLPTSDIAEVLGIRTYEVVNVLVDLQAIIQIPGTDDMPVTLCHTSLRDFLTLRSRSGRFFAHPRHHAHLYLCLIQYEFKRRQRPGVAIHLSENTPVIAYSRRYSLEHLNKGYSFLEQSEAESAVRLCRETLALHPSSPELIQALADAIYWTTEPGVSDVDLDEAISLYRQALLLRPPGDEGRWLSLHTLGFALDSYYERTGDMDSLEEAISVCRDALKLRPSPHSDRSDILHQLAHFLVDRYHRSKAMADLEEAISLGREALELQPSPHPEHLWSFSSLAMSLRERYLRTKAIADLEEAISLSREVVELRPSPHPDRSDSLHALSVSLMDRYRRNNAMPDLEEVISLNRETLELRPSPHPKCSLSLNNLAISLGERYQRTKAIADLEEAISLSREVVELRPSSHPDRSDSLQELSVSLMYRYQHNKAVPDLEEVISLDRETLELQPSPHPERSLSLNNLAISLRERYRRTKAIADLEEAISLSREVVELRPPPHPGRSYSLNKLAVSLRDRYRRTKAIADLEEAISLSREVVELRPSSHPDRSDSLHKLSISLKYRYQRNSAMPDLEEVISLDRETLELRPSPHPERLLSLNNLAISLRVRYRRTKAIADLEEAISLSREAVELRPSHPDRSDSLWILSLSLGDRFEATGVLSDLQESIPFCDELLDYHYPVGHEDRVKTLNEMAFLLQKRFDATGQEEDLARIDVLKDEISRLSGSTSNTAVPSSSRIIGVARKHNRSISWYRRIVS